MKLEYSKSRSSVSKIIKILVGILLALVLLFTALTTTLWLHSPGKTPPITDKNNQTLPDSIAEVVRVPINGVEQGMVIRGNSSQLPVLLFLHGGPGAPEYPLAKSVSAQLEELFIVCWWDQRGAGMSYSSDIPAESITVEQLIQDTLSVTEYLKERFQQQKIYILGHSWGSQLGAYAAQRQPDLYHAFIGVGQVTDQLTSEKLAYDYMLQQAVETKNSKMQKELSAFTLNGPESMTLEYLMVRNKYLNQLGIGLTHEFKSMFQDAVLPFLNSPEYTLPEKLNYMKATNFVVDQLFYTVTSSNLMKEVPKLDIPVYFIQGKYDYQTSYTLAKDYYNMLKAPKKEFFTFENSAHSPIFEEPELFIQIVKENILGSH